jgi:glucose/arabinose dehydrogenase
MRSYFKLLTISLFVTFMCYHLSYAQVYPADFAQVLVTSGITNPTVMDFAPDGRIFVAEQGGNLRVIKNNTLLTTPFITLTVNSTGDSGLMGIALDPDFSTNNYIYLYYTTTNSPGNNRISRFTANGDVVEAGSEVTILELDPLSGSTNHIGGAMHFGIDGKLYVATGENSNSANSQNLDSYHGKLLRINKDGSVPDGNPFTTGSEQRKRVWAYGLRNPYTFAVHPQTGRILVNDVGLTDWEEINDATIGGKNFGWPTTDGNFNASTYPDFTNPIYVYGHGDTEGVGCAITGGTFFSPTATNYPVAYVDKYFFQDYCGDWINTLDLSGSNAVRAPFATSISLTGLAIAQGADGNLYYISRNLGSIFKIVYNKTTAPFITSQPTSLVIAEGQAATFSVSALGSTPFAYQWKRNGVDIPGATNAICKINNASPADNGGYEVTVSNDSGGVTSTKAMLTVIANAIPVAQVITPASGSTYVAGTSINFSGGGNDPEDGPLAASALSWAIDFHHDDHKHDQPAIAGISSGSFFIPNEGETSDNVWYRIILTVTDSKGLKGKDSVDIHPRKSTLNFVTNPPGLQITLDGRPLETPVSVVSVEGMLRSVGIISPQVKDDVTHTFESWSNNGAATQLFATPTDDLSLTATFSTVVGIEDKSYDGAISIFPNPSPQTHVTISIRSSRAQKVMLRMVDLLSRDIMSVQQELHVGINEIPFYHGKITKGLYLIVVELTDRTIFKRLVVAD